MDVIGDTDWRKFSALSSDASAPNVRPALLTHFMELLQVLFVKNKTATRPLAAKSGWKLEYSSPPEFEGAFVKFE